MRAASIKTARRWDKLKPAHYCDNAYKNGFVAGYQAMQLDMIYNAPIEPRRSQS
jgi:hypothetical protein